MVLLLIGFVVGFIVGGVPLFYLGKECERYDREMAEADAASELVSQETVRRYWR